MMSFPVVATQLLCTPIHSTSHATQSQACAEPRDPSFSSSPTSEVDTWDGYLGPPVGP